MLFDGFIEAEVPSPTTKSMCPFATFFHGRISKNSALHDAQDGAAPDKQRSFIQLSKFLWVPLFNVKRRISTLLVAGLLVFQSMSQVSLPPKTNNLIQSQSTLDYVEKLYAILHKITPLSFVRVPRTAESLSAATKMQFVTRIMVERFILQKLGHMVPSNHPEFNQDNRDFTNLFIVLWSDVTTSSF